MADADAELDRALESRPPAGAAGRPGAHDRRRRLAQAGVDAGLCAAVARRDRALAEAVQAEIRAMAKVAIEPYLADGGRQDAEPRHADPAPDDGLRGRRADPGDLRRLPDRRAGDLRQVAARTRSSNSRSCKAAARKLKVLVIGAGMSGLLAGIRLSQAGVPFEIVESNADVGGTWLVNTYPGCRVDNSNHMYSYSFEPNHGWPQHFSPQPELLKYFRGVAAKYDLKEHIRFETTVESLTWDEARVGLAGGAAGARTARRDASRPTR